MPPSVSGRGRSLTAVRWAGGNHSFPRQIALRHQMTSATKHCHATGSWIVDVPANFAEIDNGDSWQGHADTRVVYVSSMKVANGSVPASAISLRATISRKLDPPSTVERHALESSDRLGDAQIARGDTGFQLKGFTCVDGCIATCIISFELPEHHDWTLATWRSLRPFTRQKTTAWWRFW